MKETYTVEERIYPGEPVSDCGCWYCGGEEGPIEFSYEFDTLVHRACLQGRLNAVPSDPEAQIISRELKDRECSSASEAATR